MIRRATSTATGQKQLAPNGLFSRGKREISAFLGTNKEGAGEKNKGPERKETMTTSKKEGTEYKKNKKTKTR